MPGPTTTLIARHKTGPAASSHAHGREDHVWARRILIGAALIFMLLFLVVPLVAVFTEALRKGLDAYFQAFQDPAAQSAIRLTLTVALIVVPLNTLFGLSAAWAITKFDFKGKNILLTLIDLPFAVSPVIAGLVFVLIFSHTWWGVWFSENVCHVIFDTPGIVLATIFVTFPFVAREIIPLMQAQGADEELAAVSLGANGWQTFCRVTLPNIKWGLLNGIILCNARAMGEFGAVSVVSGHIRGKTNTIPLHIEILYNEYQFSASFAIASLLTLLGIATLVIKAIIENRHEPGNGGVQH
ncbi:MAG: sulfate ABC transporter permease subunit CysW [Methylacidiphilales bacterium]|nr:sulfate ABC transporter permease subunit CysW [Candidatus Methylacidiphilales bacterium]